MSPPSVAAARPVIVFRQAGNNLRLGNTLVWVARAHAWCVKHGFAFYFPYARGNLAGLIDPASPLFACPAELQSSPLWSEACRHDKALRIIDGLLAKFLSIAGELQTPAIDPRPAQPVSVLPGALACVTNTRGIDWSSSDLVHGVGRHAVCIVSEPHPFLAGLEAAAEGEAALLVPSAAALALMQSAGPMLGVHIRQTDYRRWQGGRHFRDNDFYNELIDRLAQILPAGMTIHVAHDGEFVPDERVRSSAVVRVSDGSPHSVLSDFVSFAICDYLVGPMSTFTIQAGRLGALWSPKRRRLCRLDPGKSLEDVLDEVGRAIREGA